MSNGFSHESTSSESKEWYTPIGLYQWLREAGLDTLPGEDPPTGHMFDLDPCSPGKDIIPWSPAKHHLTIKDDGLSTSWEKYGRVWLNCPYDAKTNPLWLSKFVEHGAGIALLFARTDAKWFHEWALKCDGMLLIKGRVKFISPAQAAGAPAGGGPGAGSMLLSCGPICTQTLEKLDSMGRGVFFRL